MRTREEIKKDIAKVSEEWPSGSPYGVSMLLLELLSDIRELLQKVVAFSKR